ncbi:hypothetical protein BGZ54_005555 [Gamsiella multidivaricata]|nr:hypothetical protein BGZ54_005555 [Gamsiella multidivaricata]
MYLCPTLQVIDHGDWVETLCEPEEHALQARATLDHYFSYRKDDAYVSAVESRYGTAHTIVVRGSSWNNVVNQPKLCTSDGHFCFDIAENCIRQAASSGAELTSGPKVDEDDDWMQVLESTWAFANED